MSNERKFLISIGVLTLVIVFVGVFLFSGGSSKPDGGGKAALGELTTGATNVIGESTASATIVEFGDYQCPACGQAHPIVKKFLEEKGNDVYFVFRQFPLTQVHSNANDAARAAIAGGKQGKYWEMHDLLYKKQTEWSGLSDPRSKFEDYAKGLDLDLDKFRVDMNQAIGTINAEVALGKKIGVQSTPTFFVNGKMYSGVLSYDKLVELTK